MRNTTLVMTLLLSLPLPLFGQGSWTPTLSLADNTHWCATHNCLTVLGGTMSAIKAGFDGTLYGLNASGVLYTYSVASGWVEAV